MNELNGFTITGILARAFESRSGEDIELLKTEEAKPFIDNIKDYTNSDKYWMWASFVKNGQLPTSKL